MPNKKRNSTNSMLENGSNESGQVLTLVPDPPSQSKAIRFLRCYCRSSHDFVSEVEMVETNRKYLCRIFNLSPDDELLLSYPIGAAQKKYIETLSEQTLDLEKFDYFMEYNLS